MSLSDTVFGEAIQFDNFVEIKFGNLGGIRGLKIGKDWAILDNLSIVTRAKSCFLRVQERPSTKSMLTSYLGRSSTNKGV